jgi:hypothetical protein
MSHATHFLRRLERVSTPQVDFALALYRDPKLVAYMLTRANLPSGAERAALAIEDKPDGPHIVISRDGTFITCLGAGMSVGDLPVIGRAQIDRISQEIGKLREAVDNVNERGEHQQLFRRVFRAGRYLSREDFVVLSFLYPLMFMDMWRSTVDLAENLALFRDRFKPRRYRRLNQETRKDLRLYWEGAWALGHHFALHGVHASTLMDFVEPALRQSNTNLFSVMPWPAMRTMSMPIVLRGIWAVARAGRRALPFGKQFYEEAQTYMTMFTATLGLTGIGIRHRRLRAEVRKVLARRTSPIFDPGRTLPGHSDAATSVVEYCQTLIEHDEVMQARHRELGAELVVYGTRDMPEGHRLRFDRSEDVPDELAFWAPLNVDANVLGDGRAVTILGAILPWLAHAKAEDLYLPEATLSEYRAPWEPSTTLEQLESFWQFTHAFKSRASSAKTGRNDPCPCGSGKKHKRCCGA